MKTMSLVSAILAQLLFFSLSASAQEKPATKPPAEKHPQPTPERFWEVARKLKDTGKYEPKNGSTYCNWFARDFVKDLLGEGLPELTG
jgi:hypothetical protein